jgi:hypothetical protein
MKIRILRSILIEKYDRRMDEIWDKQLNKWTELNVNSIVSNGSTTDLYTCDGDIYRSLPNSAFELIKSPPTIKDLGCLTA